MIILTSLSPGHTNKENQTAAVKSWESFAPCYSMNKASEIEVLANNYVNIGFIKTEKTIEHMVGRPLVSINAMLDFAITQNTDLLLINSDNIISELPEFKQDGITIFQRYDYTKLYADGKINPLGFDAFYIPKAFLNIYPPSVFAMGAPWWDYWLPWRTMIKGIPVYHADCKCIYHKAHPMQYNYKEWTYMGEFFKLDFQFDKTLTVQHIATMMIGRIKSKLKTAV